MAYEQAGRLERAGRAQRTVTRPSKGRVNAGFLVVGLVMLGQSAFANGFRESSSWQFETSSDKTNKAAIADVVERKKGGFYDGFDTNVTNYNTTNIGTQINCNNSLSAAGNIADNRQVGNAPNLDGGSRVQSSAAGNQNSASSDAEATAGTSSQENTGTIGSTTSGNNISGRASASLGGNDQALDNRQDNSGNQTATQTDSLACDTSGSTFTGSVNSTVDGASLTAPLN